MAKDLLGWAAEKPDWVRDMRCVSHEGRLWAERDANGCEDAVRNGVEMLGAWGESA